MDRQLKSILMETPAGREYVRQEEAAKRAKSRRRSSRSPRAAPSTKPERDIAAIREKVMLRAGDACEVCGDRYHVEAHHILSGADRRRKEAPDTMLALCEQCHRMIHRNDPSTLEHAHTFCCAHNMVSAAFALGRRLEKVERTRALLLARREGETTP